MSDPRPPTPPTPDTPPRDGGDMYLWDRSEPVDHAVRDVEQVAAPLRHAGQWGGAGGVEARAARARAARVRSLAAAAVILLAVVGAWVMWPSGHITRDSGELSPWKFVAGRGVTVTRKPGKLGTPNFPTVRVRTGASSSIDLRSRDGVVVTLLPRSEVEFWEDPVSAAPSSQPLQYVGGDMVIHGAPAKSLVVVYVGGLSIEAGPASMIDVSATSKERASVTPMSGECFVHGRYNKRTSRERLLVGMRNDIWLANDAVSTAIPLSSRADPKFVEAIEQWRADGTDEQLRKLLQLASLSDIGTLWNLAFELSYDETEREQLVSAIGRLTGRWPAVIKTTKEPPWSQTFADDWWEIVRQSYPYSQGSTGSGPADDRDGSPTTPKRNGKW